MRVMQRLSVLALQQVLGERADSLINFLGDRYSDPSKRLLSALELANERAWKALEISLAGSTWWDKCKVSVSSVETKSFRTQVQSFLDGATVQEAPAPDPAFRKQCLTELRTARQGKLLPGVHQDHAVSLAQQSIDTFARYTDPHKLIECELQHVMATCDELQQSGFPTLAHFVRLQPDGGRPLLLVAVRYFFRRVVETDDRLRESLTFQHLERLTESQQTGFASLHTALEEQGQRLETLLHDAIDILTQTHALVEQTHDIVQQTQRQLDEMQQQFQRDQEQSHRETQTQLQALMAMVSSLLQQQGQPPMVVPAPVMHAEHLPEITQAEALIARVEALPLEQRQKMPEIVRSMVELKATVARYDPATGRRRKVLPSALFMGQTTTDEIKLPETPGVTSMPIVPKAGMVDSPFGLVPKSKRKLKPE